MDAFLKGIVFAVAVIGLTMCQDCFNFKRLATTPTSKSQFMEQNHGMRSVLECTKMCSLASPCDFVQYCRNERTCSLYEQCAACTAVFVNCSDGNPPITVSRIQPAPIVCDVNINLVTGPDGVADNQLSANTFWCESYPTVQFCIDTPDGLGAKYARLNLTGLYDCWSPPNPVVPTNWIQVDFLTTRLTTGIVLTGRPVPAGNQYVKAFKVLYSLDCATFTHIQDEFGNDNTFAGCTNQDDVVTRMFEQPIPARCIRINPTDWQESSSIRFDVLGC